MFSTFCFPRNISPASDLARETFARTQLEFLDYAVRIFLRYNGRLPGSLEELTTLDAEGRSCLEELPLDPWGNAYCLRRTAPYGKSDWLVECLGPDGCEDSGDEFRSRERR